MASPSSLSVDLSQAFVMAPPGLGEWLVILPPALMITAGALLMMMRHRVDHHGFIAIPALVALVLMGLVWAARKFLADKWPWLKTDRGGAVLLGA